MMGEYYDLSTNINMMVGTLEENNYNIKDYISSYFGFGKKKEIEQTPVPKAVVDKELLKVRNSICIVGYNAKAIQFVKQRIASLVDHPLPIESLHIRKFSDVKDGALLVPKIVLVATHCPGKKLIDDEGDSGQLDKVYDEVCDIGADILVVYLGLPKAIYKPARHMVYHPRMADIVFPTQPTLRTLAENYSLITVLEKSDLSSMQKNVIREYLARPVGKDHPVYAQSDKLLEMSFSDAEFWSETEIYRYKKPVPYHATTQYASAYEDKPPPEKVLRKKKKNKKSNAVPVGQLISFDTDGAQGHMELEMYNGENNESEGLIVSLTV